MNNLFLDIDWRFFDEEYLGEKVSQYLLFGGIILLSFILKRPIASLLARLSSVITSKYSYLEYKVKVKDLLLKPMERLVLVVLFYMAVNQLDGLLDHFTFHHSLGQAGKLNYTLSDVADHIFLFIFIIILTQAISRLIDFVYYIRSETARKENNLSRVQLLPLIKEMSKLLLWVLSCFWLLGSVFHVNIPALVAGLGIGGVAIALAAKETVENFFAAFTILSDKPFLTGDAIKLGDVEAVVERIGFRSTRLRNLDGSAYIIPNQKLVSQNLINLSQRDRRGMNLKVNIKYGVSNDTLHKVIDELRPALLLINPVKEPIQISIEGFDKETFLLTISYDLPYPLPDSLQLADIKRAVNLKVFEVITANAVMGTAAGTS